MCAHEWLRLPEALAAAGIVWVERVVPDSAYPTWSMIESVALGGLGILCLALAFPVIDRRRPQP